MTVSEHSHQPEGLHPRQLARLEEHVRHAPLLSAERLLQAAYAHLEDVQGLHVQRPEVDADLAATICHILDRVVSDWDSFTPVEQSWLRARCSILPKKMTRCLITPNAVSTTMLKCSMPAFGSPGGPIGYCRLLAAPDSGAAFGNTPDTPRSWLSAVRRGPVPAVRSLARHRRLPMDEATRTTAAVGWLGVCQKSGRRGLASNGGGLRGMRQLARNRSRQDRRPDDGKTLRVAYGQPIFLYRIPLIYLPDTITGCHDWAGNGRAWHSL